MELLDHDSEGATIHLDEREVRMVMALVEEGRLAYNCKEPTGQALDELLRTADALIQNARKTKKVLPRYH